MGKKTLLAVDIKFSDLDEVKEIIKNQQELINSQARVLEGFISDVEDIKACLINVRDSIRKANETVSLEEHDECLNDADNSLNYIIDYLLVDIEENYKQ